MKLQLFNGGLNTRIAPNLIGISEGVAFENIRVDSAILEPEKKKADTGFTLNKYAFFFRTVEEWVSSTTDKDYLEYQEKLYSSDGINIPSVYNGVVTNLLGIANPTSIPSVADGGAGALTGTYSYVYTYYNSVTGYESATSYLSAELVVAAKQINITNIVPSTDSQVTHIKLYRVGGTLTTFTLVIVLDKAVISYIDNITDITVVGDLLESQTYLQAPVGAKYITEAYAMMFVAVRDKLYFTPIGKPYAWPVEYFIDFPLTITGIGVLESGLIIFTRLEAYIVTGTTPDTLSRYKFSEVYGCISHKTIQNLSRGLVWQSQRDLCTSVGGTPVSISRDKLGQINLTPINAVVHNDVYYLQHLNGILAFDVRFGPIFKDITIGASYLVEGNNKLYGYFSAEYKELFVGTENENMHFKSANFIEGAYTNRKNYKTIYVRSEGQITFKIFIDGVEVLSKDLTTTDTHEVKIPQEYKNGYSIQFDITGTGKVYEVDYSPFGRNS